MDVLPIRSTPAASRHLAGLDWLRAGAAFGVVLLHASVPYAKHPMPGLAWPVSDGASQWVDVVLWSIELFIMPLFLAIAGFLALGALQRRGPRQLVQHRARRLLIPLAFGMLIVLPADLHCWVLGWVIDGLVEPIKLRSFKFDGHIDRDLWGLSHLWFLPYLFLYICVLAVAAALKRRGGPARWTDWPLLHWGFALLGLAWLVLVVRPEVVWGFQHAFLPVPSKWLYSGCFFAGGVALASRSSNLDRLINVAPRLWPPAVCLSLAALTMGQWHLEGGDHWLARGLLAALTSLSAVLLVGALMGTAVAKLQRVPTAIEYLAAASFWVYIVHHPIVGLIHIDLHVLLPGVGPEIKTILAFILASSFSLLAYEGLVRKTALGRWLGFSWQPARTGPDPTPETDIAGSIGPPTEPTTVPATKAA